MRPIIVTQLKHCTVRALSARRRTQAKISKVGPNLAEAMLHAAHEERTGNTRDSSVRAERNWDSLGARLKALVTMKRQWGELHDIYETRAESLFELTQLPACTRDPESQFSSIWDLVSVFLLLYVSASVPLRAGFAVEVELWTLAFFFDMLVDIFFITDLCLNFRTAFYDKNGPGRGRLGGLSLSHRK